MQWLTEPADVERTLQIQVGCRSAILQLADVEICLAVYAVGRIVRVLGIDLDGVPPIAAAQIPIPGAHRTPDAKNRAEIHLVQYVDRRKAVRIYGPHGQVAISGSVMLWCPCGAFRVIRKGIELCIAELLARVHADALELRLVPAYDLLRVVVP